MPKETKPENVIECPECGARQPDDYEGRCVRCDFPIAFGADYERVSTAREKRLRAAEEAERQKREKETKDKPKKAGWRYF